MLFQDSYSNQDVLWNLEDGKCVSVAVSHLLVTSQTVTHQAPLPMRFPRQEYWSRLPFPPPGDIPDPGIEPTSPPSPTLQADSLPLRHQRYMKVTDLFCWPSHWSCQCFCDLVPTSQTDRCSISVRDEWNKIHLISLANSWTLSILPMVPLPLCYDANGISGVWFSW